MTDHDPPPELVARFRQGQFAARQLARSLADDPAVAPGDVRMLSDVNADRHEFVVVVDVDDNARVATVHHVSVDIEDATRTDIIVPKADTGLRMDVMVAADIVSPAWLGELGPRFGSVEAHVIDAMGDVRDGFPPAGLTVGPPFLDGADRRWSSKDNRLDALLELTAACAESLFDREGSGALAPAATGPGSALLFTPIAAAAAVTLKVGTNAGDRFDCTVADATGVIATLRVLVYLTGVRVGMLEGSALVDSSSGERIAVGRSVTLPAESGTPVTLVLERLRLANR